ncbi:basic phospholipase A2 sphenotoxin subunit B-like [Indicator indicator]|uniref:basic phospholipase A2 sphenotoxin subunit B-like n=1 Tax=Indicator indicator TaxID=1002788 RepID=UPI0023DF5963|nr:basic phospholipase A2 sphenotoxin subunit B-like [Indicator indicator]
MNSLLAFTLLLALGLAPAHGSILQLYKMISKATGKDALLHYSLYGCYCGLGGRGTPKDATDRCCQVHDQCYSNLLKKYHCDAKVQEYHYRWLGGLPTCKEESWCGHHSCQCDRSLALCLQRNIKSYSVWYLFYNKKKCH